MEFERSEEKLNNTMYQTQWNATATSLKSGYMGTTFTEKNPLNLSKSK